MSHWRAGTSSMFPTLSQSVPRIGYLALADSDPDFFPTCVLNWLVVGDARTQLDRVRALGLGDPVMLDHQGVPIG